VNHSEAQALRWKRQKRARRLAKEAAAMPGRETLPDLETLMAELEAASGRALAAAQALAPKKG